MITYSSIFMVSVHEDTCALSIRTTENRVDSFFFSADQIESFCGYMGDRDKWIGKDKLFIKIGHKSRVKINKGHATVAYAIEERDAIILIAQLEDIFHTIKKVVLDEKKDRDPKISQVGSSITIEEISELIDRKLAQHRQILLHEIDNRLQRIEFNNISEPIPSDDICDAPTPTFIPSRMGTTLVGRIRTEQHTANTNVSEASETLKRLKDKE
tara:strand:- start:1421 stop:2059 length:639 start_codon:yes stop_codon:yes gene_type:complete